MTSSTNETQLQDRQMAFRDLMMELLPSDENRKITDRIMIFRRSETSDVNHGESALALCMIAEGSKNVLLGDEVFTYDKDHYFVTSMELPTESYVSHATEEQPYLSVRMMLDPEIVRSVLLSGTSVLPTGDGAAAFNVASTNAELIDATIRLLRVWQSTEDAEILAPLIEREIVYRLLKGNHGGRLAHIAGLGPTSQGVTHAINKLKDDFDKPLSIPEIARECGMSVSGFHNHFKRATGMTPLQFQKHLRLREARRLLLSEDIDVAGAGFQVGYNDPSHFNRDYKKLFGQSPMRDVEKLRAMGPLAIAPN